MIAQKAACHKSLDERERCVDQMKHLQDDAVRDHADFEMAVEMLRRESDDLDDRNRRAEGVLEAATENEKRAQFSQMRKARARKEKLEVRYGYLRSQLEGVDNDFRELQRIVGVHFQPSHPESLQQIIDKFVEKERRVASLQKYWALQADEIGGLEFELASLGRELEYAEGVVAEAAAQEAFAQSFNAKVAPWDDGALDALTARFAKCSTWIERMFALLGGDLTETGQHLAAKGCTVSTLTDFLSTMAARLDETSRRAHSLRETAQTHRATATVSRRPNEATMEAFLRPRAVGGSADGEGGAPAPTAAGASGAPGAAAGARRARGRRGWRRRRRRRGGIGGGRGGGDEARARQAEPAVDQRPAGGPRRRRGAVVGRAAAARQRARQGRHRPTEARQLDRGVGAEAAAGARRADGAAVDPRVLRLRSRPVAAAIGLPASVGAVTGGRGAHIAEYDHLMARGVAARRQVRGRCAGSVLCASFGRDERQRGRRKPH